FQAEDGIRDRNVTGVQTCALPISADASGTRPSRLHRDNRRRKSVGDDGKRMEREHDPSTHITCSRRATSGGAEGTRTPNPLLAKQMRYQLRHGPRRSLTAILKVLRHG